MAQRREYWRLSLAFDVALPCPHDSTAFRLSAYFSRILPIFVRLLADLAAALRGGGIGKELQGAAEVANKAGGVAALGPDAALKRVADGQAPYGRVQQLLAAANQAGVARVGFVAESTGPGRRPGWPGPGAGLSRDGCGT